MRQMLGAAVVAYAVACGGHAGGPHDGGVIDAPVADAPTDATVNPAGTIGRYEAEDQTLVGSAAVVGAADLSSRAQGDLGGEASVRRAVTLSAPGDGIRFAVVAANAGANGVVVRYSLPDLPGGGGQTAPLALTATAADGTPLVTETLTLTSRYAWAYGSVAAGTKVYNVPANALANDGSDLAIHIYDETQLLLAAPLPAGATVALTLPAGAPPVTVDFVELEIVPPPLVQPAGTLSITDPQCGAIPLDTRGTGRAFDGADDSSYASVFDAGSGINPFNPTGSDGVQPAGTQEKDYYTNGSADVLQDGSASPASANLSMFALADQNANAISTCLALASGSGATGVWIPPGRYYARGTVVVPSGATIRGAGIWYSKLVAVDTAPPEPETNQATGLSGIASTSGDLRFTVGSDGASAVTISDLAMFGNVTQRDVVDRFIPIGVTGAFSASTFERLWVEHYSQGLVLNGSATGDLVSELRVRDTFADGIDLFGDTSHTTIANSKTRATGDDGFAVWSQSATTVSTGNTVTSDLAELPWFGDGFAVYGGTNATLTDDTAIDTLSIAGFKLATTFVAPSLPPTFVMTGVFVSNGKLIRCGGDAFAQHNGALQIGPEQESIEGMIIDQVTIDDPTFAAVDLRVISSIGKVATPGSVGVALANIVVLGGGSACATVGAQMSGSATLDAACACAAVGSAATACTGSNASPATFAVETSCPEASCP